MRFRQWLPFLLLSAVICALFAPSLGFEFLNWDDSDLLTSQPWFRNPSLTQLLALLSPYRLLRPEGVEYAPVRDLFYAFDLWLWGPAPWGFHVSQVLIHAANAILLVFLLQKTFSKPLAWATALLWAVHPVMTEPVAWIASRKDLLCGLFSLAALLSWNKRRDTLGTLFAALALFSKISAVSLPLIAWVVCHERRNERRFRFQLGGLLVLGFAISTFITWANLHKASVITSSDWPAMFQIAPGLFRQLLLPWSLNARYAQVTDLSWTSPLVIAGLVLLIGYLTTLVITWKRQPEIAQGLAFFGLAYLPYSQLIPTNIWLADRYLYVASIGAVWALTALVSHFTRAKPLLGPWGLGMLAVACIPLTLQRLPVWRNSVTLWTDTAQRSPNLYYVWGNLGQAYMEIEKPGEAAAHFQTALQLHPSWAKGWLYLAQANLQQGATPLAQKALAQFEVIATSNERRATLALAALVNAQVGDSTRAENLFREHLTLHPEDAEAWANSGVLFISLRREPEAVKAWERAVELDPTNPTGRINRARFHFLHQRCPEALSELESMRRGSSADEKTRAWISEQCGPARRP